LILSLVEARALKEIIRAWGYDPEKVLVREALAEQHRTICIEPSDIRENEVKLLRNALKEMLRKELLNTMKAEETKSVYGPPEMHK
jgi:hypothetical protein